MPRAKIFCPDAMRAANSGGKRLIAWHKSSLAVRSGGAKRIACSRFTGKPPAIDAKAPGFGWD